MSNNTLHNTDEVKKMYQKFPYPSPVVGETLIADNVNLLSLLFPGSEFPDKKILDAGCGTGQRMLAVAKRFPLARVTGIDLTPASLEVAGKLAEKHALNNVTLLEKNLLKLDLAGSFDIIYSSGVIHHLENPALGLKNLCERLSQQGIIIIWLYHSLGEHQRLLDRELLLTLAGNNSELEERYQLMNALNLNLDTHRYGSSASQSGDEVSRASIDTDAYIHPIVNAYRVQEAVELFDDSIVDWVAVNGLNTALDSKLMDLQEAAEPELREICIQASQLFGDEFVVEKFKTLDIPGKLAVIELMMKPTGFTLIAGRYDSYNQLGPRITGNLLKKLSPGGADRGKSRVSLTSSKDDYSGFDF